jgi:CubicO group peptidase (beta-lactamase class C family)
MLAKRGKFLMLWRSQITQFIVTFSIIALTACSSSSSLTPVQGDYWPTDAWRETTPEKQGMNSQYFKSLRGYVEENFPHMSSVLVVRHGYIVFEESYQGEPNDYQNVASVAKSVISALIGIALREGYINSLDQKVVDFYPEYVTPTSDPQIKDITIEHLLTMTSGLEQETSFGEDWFKSTLEQPVSDEPGQAFHYNDAAVHLLSGILTRSTHMTALEFGNEYLFQPLGIPLPSWKTDPQGNNVGGDGLALRPRDMAKIGYLYLNQGFWDGHQLVPAEWVRVSTEKHAKADFLSGYYGYLWWVTAVEGHAAYYAAGFGGQYIYVIPDLDLVVVITGNASAFPEFSKYLDIVPLFIVRGTSK